MAIVVGSIIGSGIFSTPSLILQEVGSTGMTLLVWSLGGAISLCGCLSYMELGTMLPRSGGEKEYLDVAFPRPRAMFSYMFCLCGVFISSASGAAADAVVTGAYFLYAANGSSVNADGQISKHAEWMQRLVGLGVVMFCTMAHAVFVRQAIRLQNLLTVLKTVLLLVIVLVGLVGLAGGLRIDSPHSFKNPFHGTVHDASAYSSALFKVFFSYAGYTTLNYSIDELKDPLKNLPRAAIGGLLVTTALYILTNIAYFSVLTPDAIMRSNTAVAGVFFSHAFNETWGHQVVPVFIGLAAFGTVMCSVFTMSRIIFEAAREGFLPWGHTIGQVSRFQSPLYALAITCIICVLYIVVPPPGDAYNFLIDIGGYPTWFFCGLSVVGLLVMRRTHSGLDRPYKTWVVTNLVTIATAVYMCIVPFIKPKTGVGSSDDSSIPYWAAPFSGLLFIAFSCAMWYIRIVRQRGLETSYYARFGYPTKSLV
ncbi:amino acid transporter [Linderina pennispora]|uniref:Amino acid transporter n=1 Tax=Linderina pennispora TaxID=61395 RepID=A0A1Y1W779_9FUNG|nr:amino acid transporter [Linderina pennispora]ORX69381.1 amino acid transporter [Linderina pennispora]